MRRIRSGCCARASSHAAALRANGSAGRREQLPLTLICARTLVGIVPPHEAASSGAEYRMVTSMVTRYSAYDSSFYAPFGPRRHR